MSVPLSRNVIRSEVWVYSGAGHGSTNTAIRRFVTTGRILGTDISYFPSPTLGDTFVINKDGVYCLSYIDAYSGGQTNFGASVNSTQLSSNINGLNPADTLGFVNNPTAGAPAYFGSMVNLKAGDIVRAHTQGVADSTTPLVQFRIVKVSD